MTLEKSQDISQITSDTGGVGDDTPKLTNLRVTTQARDDANYIAGALGMEQRATVEGILRVVRKAVDANKLKDTNPAYLRRAVLGVKE